MYDFSKAQMIIGAYEAMETTGYPPEHHRFVTYANGTPFHTKLRAYVGEIEFEWYVYHDDRGRTDANAWIGLRITNLDHRLPRAKAIADIKPKSTSSYNSCMKQAVTEIQEYKDKGNIPAERSQLEPATPRDRST